MIASCSRTRERSSSLAITAAPGRPVAISSAMFGPGEHRDRAGRATSVERRAPVAGSRPFDRLRTGASRPRTCSSTLAERDVGSATGASTTRSASVVRARLVDACRRASARERRRGRGRAAGAQNAVPHAPAADDDDSHDRSPEVDRHRHALQLEPLAQLVLDPVGVVARDEAGIVDGEPEARRPRRRPARRRAGSAGARPSTAAARTPSARARNGSAPRSGSRADVAVVQLLDLVEQARDAAAGLRRDRDEGGPLAQPALRARAARPRSSISEMSHFESTISVEQCALRATSTAVMSPSTIPSLASIRTSATSARSAASSARSSE